MEPWNEPLQSFLKGKKTLLERNGYAYVLKNPLAVSRRNKIVQMESKIIVQKLRPRLNLKLILHLWRSLSILFCFYKVH